MRKHEFPRSKSVAVLLDPDKAFGQGLENILKIATEAKADYIFAGGSITFNSIEDLISNIKMTCNIPVFLFPGNLLQLSRNADGILLLSLISGRNPELLIGNHVTAAPFLRDVREKLVSVGYILVGGGQKTSVEYISQTEAIPPEKPEIVVATALAGEMLGLNMIYLEGGSGAVDPVPMNIVSAVRQNITIPIAVGGGLKSPEEVMGIFNSGADLIILGNSCEKNPDLLAEACKIRDKLR